MSILPKILYLFRVLTIQVPSYFLRILQQKALHFIWGKIKPRLPQPTLYTPHMRGGISVPNFSKYYYAAQLAQLPKYHATKEIPLWVALRSVDCDPLSTANLLWLTPLQRCTITNPITEHSLSIWDRLKRHFSLQALHNPLLYLIRNPSFYPAWTSPPSFLAWSQVGLLQAHHFFLQMVQSRLFQYYVNFITFLHQKFSGTYKLSTSSPPTHHLTPLPPTSPLSSKLA